MKKIKIKRHIPGLMTFINLFLGFLAILNTQSGAYDIACYCIILAGAFDSIDGKIARMMGISSSFGVEIDSLADMVSFCLAPSVIIYSLYTHGLPGITGEIIASAPMVFGAIRLARFNVSQEDKPSSYFTGLPTPMNAFAIATLVLFIENIKLSNPEYSQPRLLLPIIFSISFLMVSKIRFGKFPLLNFRSGLSNTLALLGVGVFTVSFIIALFYNLESWILMIFVGVYILIGLLRHILFQNSEEELQLTGENE